MLMSPLATAALLNVGSGLSVYRTLLSLGPVAMWPLNESSGATAADATGNGHTGTYVSGVGTIKQGQGSLLPSGEGRSLYINGQNFLDAGVTAPDAVPLRLTTDGTIVVWSNCEFGWWNVLVAKEQAGAGFAVVSQDGQRIQLGTRSGAGTQVLTSPVLTLGTHLFAVRWNAAGNASCWADSVKVAEQIGGWVAAAAGNGQVEIGYGTFSGVGTVGREQFVGLFNRALSDDEIRLIGKAQE